jgi:peptidoglycan/xylan/chitin deacetylase (PgdA/CDA1 family)
MSDLLARDFVGYGEGYPRVTWPGDARVAVSIVVNFEEGSERSPLHGDPSAGPPLEGFVTPPGVRELRKESFFEYGPRVGLWRLLEIFDRASVPVTVNACGMALELNPLAAQEFAQRRYDMCGHGYRWLPLYMLSDEQEREHIHKAVAAITATVGYRPVGWNSRGPSERTRAFLIEEGGFIYDSDSYNDDLPYYVAAGERSWLTIPYSFETNDMKYLRSPGHSAPADFEAQLRSALECLHREGETHPKMMSVGLHLRLSGRMAAAAAVEGFLKYAQDLGDVWFATRAEIARWWLLNYPPPSG